MSRGLRFAPLVVGALLLAALVWRLANPSDNRLQSRLVGKPLPSFVLPAAVAIKPALRSADLAKGQPTLLNIFASWCVPCVAEAPVLADLHRRGVRIDGIAIRDKPQDIAAFLAEHGDPFRRIGRDDNSMVQVVLGSSGVPESLIIDGRGTIRYHHIGPITPDQVPMIMAELGKAQ